MVTPVQTYMIEDDSLPNNSINDNAGTGDVSSTPTPWWVWILVALVGYQAFSDGGKDDT